MTVFTVPLTKASDPDWFRDHENLAELYRWLDEACLLPPDPAYLLEKPWKFAAYWQQCCAEALETALEESSRAAGRPDGLTVATPAQREEKAA